MTPKELITVQGPVVTNPEWAEAALKLTAEALDGAPKDRTPVVHDLKIWPEFFEPVVDGRKTFELRRDDRGYRVGEVLRLREFHIEGGKGKYTGREVERVITYVSQQGAPFLQPGYVALGLGEPPVAVSALAGPGADLIDTTSTGAAPVEQRLTTGCGVRCTHSQGREHESKAKESPRPSNPPQLRSRARAARA